jgi:hypothetical protein
MHCTQLTVGRYHKRTVPYTAQLELERVAMLVHADARSARRSPRVQSCSVGHLRTDLSVAERGPCS